jgi:hypothetical protein
MTSRFSGRVESPRSNLAAARHGRSIPRQTASFPVARSLCLVSQWTPHKLARSPRSEKAGGLGRAFRARPSGEGAPREGAGRKFNKGAELLLAASPERSTRPATAGRPQQGVGNAEARPGGICRRFAGRSRCPAVEAGRRQSRLPVEAGRSRRAPHRVPLSQGGGGGVPRGGATGPQASEGPSRRRSRALAMKGGVSCRRIRCRSMVNVSERVSVYVRVRLEAPAQGESARRFQTKRRGRDGSQTDSQLLSACR